MAGLRDIDDLGNDSDRKVNDDDDDDDDYENDGGFEEKEDYEF